MTKDFSIYKNSTIIPDQSAWQAIEDMTSRRNVHVFNFFKLEGVIIKTTEQSMTELSLQIYCPNLLSGTSSEFKSGDSTCLSIDNKTNYVFSRSNASLTPKYLDNDGYDVKIESIISDSSQTAQQPLLWESSFAYKRMERKDIIDPSNIILARKLAGEGINPLLFTSDKDQITQCNIEGFDYLEPFELLIWMEKDKFIKSQKSVWVYEKWKKGPETMSWTRKYPKFMDIRKNYK